MKGPSLAKRIRGRLPPSLRRVVKRVSVAARAVRKASRRHAPAPLARAWLVLAERTGLDRYEAPRERDACPACEARDVEHLLPLQLHGCIEGRWVGFVSGCRRCGIVFANPMPTPAMLAQHYSPEGAWGRPRQEPVHDKVPALAYFVRLFDSLRPGFAIDAPPAGGAALDFGCGSGELLNALQDFGWTTSGIEPSERIAFTRHRELGAIPETPMFDLVIAHHVLEHVSDPLRILRALQASLKPDGVILVSVPRLDTLFEHQDFSYCINDRTHIVSYTRDAMATLLQMAGFDPIDLNPPPGEEDESDWRGRRRLRMIGRKAKAVRVSVPDPLSAARRALERWQGGSGRSPQEISHRDHRDKPYGGKIPVRAAAAIMNLEREREHDRRRGRVTIPEASS